MLAPGRRARAARHRPRQRHRPVRCGASPSPAACSCRSSAWTEILEIDTENHVAVVQPGVTLAQLDEATRAPRPRLPGVPRREQRQPRRQRGHQRRRHAGGEVRRHPPPGARPGGVLALGRGHPHRRQGREGHHRLRPHPAHHRLRGHPGPRHRGHPAPATRDRRTRVDRPGPVRHPRRGHRRGARASSPAASARCILEYIDLLTMAPATAYVGPRPRHPRGRASRPPSPTSWWCSRAAPPSASTRTSRPSPTC